MPEGQNGPTELRPPSTAEADRVGTELKGQLDRARRLVEEARSFLSSQSSREAAFKKDLADDVASWDW